MQDSINEIARYAAIVADCGEDQEIGTPCQK
jgi:hypothetical protein